MQAFDALLTALDTRGTRESHLHIMLQRIEACFKECVRRNRLSHDGDKGRHEDVELNSSFAFENAESPSSAVCSTSSDALEPSLSFRIEVGKNEKEGNNFMKRYEDLQNWMWKECFNSSIVCALAYGMKRCSPLLGICDICLTTYAEDNCPCCRRAQGKIAAKGHFPMQFNGENNLMDGTDSPLRIRLIKTILNSLEVLLCVFFCILGNHVSVSHVKPFILTLIIIQQVAVPSEALHSSWTEDLRNSWGYELQSSSSIDGLLQVLTSQALLL